MIGLLNKLFQVKDQNMDYFPKNIFLKPTPFFYTDISIINNRYQQIKTAFKNNWSGKNIIAFSFKTNYPITKKIKNINGIYAEVVSEMEYKKAKKINFLDSKIIYNGPFKENLHKLLKLPLIINIDNFSEVKKIIKYKKNIKANIGIRLNSNFKKSRFGFNIENGEAQKTIDELQKNQIKISGLHIHLGFYSSPRLYRQVSQKIVKLIKKSNLKISYIDFGGGFPSHGLKPYGFNKYSIPTINEYISQTCSPLKTFYKNKDKPILIIEPGRFLVDDSTIFVAKIISYQIIKNKQIITINATNQMLSSVWFRPQIVKVFPYQKNKIINTVVYGSSCQENDILFEGKLPIIKSNGLLVFYCVGAYNQNMTSKFIFPKPKNYFLN